MTTENTATAYFAWESTLGPYADWTGEQRAEREHRFKALPPRERYLVKRDRVESNFTDENRRPDETEREISSPSGRYRLQVCRYGTKPGCWDYSRGEVFRVEDGQRVADVKRNYSSFWHLFVEDHKLTGHDYLVCGEDYQGHTVVDLTTGEVMSHIPDEAFRGHGWCPTSAALMGDGLTLEVHGCYWAGPYETRLWDFSNPLPDPGVGLPRSALLGGVVMARQHTTQVRVTDESRDAADALSRRLTQAFGVFVSRPEAYKIAVLVALDLPVEALRRAAAHKADPLDGGASSAERCPECKGTFLVECPACPHGSVCSQCRSTGYVACSCLTLGARS